MRIQPVKDLEIKDRCYGVCCDVGARACYSCDCFIAACPALELSCIGQWLCVFVWHACVVQQAGLKQQEACQVQHQKWYNAGC